jgi:hypothetical protein
MQNMQSTAKVGENKQSIFLSIPLSLLAGTFIIDTPEAYKKANHSSIFSFGGASC